MMITFVPLLPSEAKRDQYLSLGPEQAFVGLFIDYFVSGNTKSCPTLRMHACAVRAFALCCNDASISFRLVRQRIISLAPIPSSSPSSPLIQFTTCELPFSLHAFEHVASR